ncbi:MAG: O-antigen ligase family protein [Kiritimatiellae bacterium]|nr:O-antigen ligase family protein [Kiritimatiellia bacterium]
MSFLVNNAAAIAVGAVVAALGWMFGGTRGSLLTPVVPWLSVLMVEVLVCFPQRRHGENTYGARDRVWRELKKDPMTWLVVGFLALLALPFVNNGLCVNCDAAKIAQGISPDPPVRFLPFCVNRIDHLNVFLWFAAALPAMLIVRRALEPRGKRLVLELAVWNGVALAALGFVQHALDAPGPLWSEASGLVSGKVGDFFSTFGYPNMAGDYFTLLFGISVALWRRRAGEVREERRMQDISGAAAARPRNFWTAHYFLIPSAIFFYAALNTLSRAAIMLVTASAVVYFLHAFVAYLARLRRAQRVKATAVGLLAAGAIVFVATLFAPEDLRREVDTIGTTEVLDRVTGRGQYHTRVATAIWGEHKLFGVGGWGYVHFCIPMMTPEERADVQMVGGINVHNDYLQFLAEHGVAGFGALAAMVVLLVLPIGRAWRRMAHDTRFLKPKDLPPRPVQVFVLPAPVFCLLVALGCTLVHAFGDCPLRSPAVLTLFFAALAAMPGFMPEKGCRCCT